MNQKNIVPLGFSIPLLGILFFHMICESMIIPVLAPTLANPISPDRDMLLGYSEQAHKFFYGLALAVYPALVFLFAPIIGAISDSIGRRPVLIVALIGTIIGCVAQGFGMEFMSIIIFIFGRALVGATAGIDGVIQAALIDKCQDDENKKNFYLGASLLAMSIGFMAGPAFSAIMIDESASSLAWSIPFFVLAPIFLFTLIAVWGKIPSIEHTKSLTSINWLAGITDISELFKIKPARKLIWIFILAHVGAGCFVALTPLVLDKTFGFSVKEIAMFISLQGVCASFVFAVLGPLMLKHFSKNFILRFAMFMSVVTCATIYLEELGKFIWINAAMFSLGFSLAYYIILSIMADSATENRRGWLLSVLSSLWGLTMGIGLLLCGVVVGISNGFGIIVCSLLCLAAFLFSLERLKPFKVKDTKN